MEVKLKANGHLQKLTKQYYLLLEILMHMDKKEGTIWTILNNRMEQCLKWWNTWRVKKQDWLSGIVFDTRFHTDIWGPWEYRGKHRIQKPLPEVFCEKRCS